MENFIVSARKYRPATFDTVVGQFSITSTLKNAIKNRHLAQAFLFCGPRGVGKTTCARILAKTINCQNTTSAIEACDKCDSCLSFNIGHSLNVFELDAASNNSVDDIRNLVEQVRFAPQLGTHKVYIIDEVHMLSQAAFNAFLKTLEEPPSHAIFILATTEKHKIIPTILSRCQIFDFNRIQIEDIVKHLQYIGEQENIDTEPDALHIIGQKADGALRDALSIFDQIVTFTGNNVTYKAVIENLNILDYDYYFKIADAVLVNDIPNALLIFNEILNYGFDGHNFIVGMASHFRNILVCKDASTIQLLEVGNNIKDRYKLQATNCSQQFLLEALGITNKYDIQYKSSKNPRLLVELALMQLCSLNNTATLNVDQEKKNNIIMAPVATVNAVKQVVAVSAADTEISRSLTEISPPNKVIKEDSAVKPQQKEIKSPGKIKTISISQITGKNSLSTVNEPAEIYEKQENDQPGQLFNLDNLMVVWNEYATLVKGQGKSNLYATLTAYKPDLKEDNVIVITINNEVQKEELKVEQTELISYLRKGLSNSSISLNIIVNETDKEKKPYTSQDKFKRMAEKNPNINKLKQKLDLELDF